MRMVQRTIQGEFMVSSKVLVAFDFQWFGVSAKSSDLTDLAYRFAITFQTSEHILCKWCTQVWQNRMVLCWCGDNEIGYCNARKRQNGQQRKKKATNKISLGRTNDDF